MPKSENQKGKLLYLYRLLFDETDEEHGMTLEQIKNALKVRYDITVGRKTLYADFMEIERFLNDMNPSKNFEEEERSIEKRTVNRITTYHLRRRSFNPAELQLLVDAVQSARFMSREQSKELIRKLSSLAGRHQGRMLEKEVLIVGRIKSPNKDIYSIVNTIHEAIRKNRKISFLYHDWNLKKNLVPRRDGKIYVQSPWHLCWDDDKYYMISFDSEAGKIKHFRVDKMGTPVILNEMQDGKSERQSFNAEQYEQRLFGMFGGEDVLVTMECDNSLIGIMIDRFGSDIPITDLKNGTFRLRVNVCLSNQFLAWVISLGTGIRITDPPRIIERMQDIASSLADIYGTTQ